MKKLVCILSAALLLVSCGEREVVSPKVDHVIIIGLDAMSAHGMQRQFLLTVVEVLRPF